MPDADDNRHRIVDLFAGCGGMSLGFELAGFVPVVAVEKDIWASDTYRRNHPAVNVVTEDITKIVSPETRFPEANGIVGIIGGPPCQGFSLSGNRDPKDPRNSLFMDYMRFVRAFVPRFFVLENVQGILSAKTQSGDSVKDIIRSVAKSIGYNTHIAVLNAADYGVPQARVRVFFIGLHESIPFDPERLTPPPSTDQSQIPLQDALSDLPSIEAGQSGDGLPYATPPQNAYQVWCRKNAPDTVENHVAMKHTQRLVSRFSVIKFGESVADVPQEHMQRKRGNAAEISGKTYSQNNLRPFPDRPSPTLPASFQSNFVHPFHNRNYTAREGARIQSFPDSYVFCGKRTTMSWDKNLSQYQQIGNSVPPLLARAIAENIAVYLGLKNSRFFP